MAKVVPGAFDPVGPSAAPAPPREETYLVPSTGEVATREQVEAGQELMAEARRFDPVDRGYIESRGGVVEVVSGPDAERYELALAAEARQKQEESAAWQEWATATTIAEGKSLAERGAAEQLKPFYIPPEVLPSGTYGPARPGGIDIKAALKAGITSGTLLTAGFTQEQVTAAQSRMEKQKPFVAKPGLVIGPATSLPEESFGTLFTSGDPRAIFGPAGPLKSILYPSKEEYATRFVGIPEGGGVSDVVYLGSPESPLERAFKHAPIVGPAVSTYAQREYLTTSQQVVGYGLAGVQAAFIFGPKLPPVRASVSGLRKLLDIPSPRPIVVKGRVQPPRPTELEGFPIRYQDVDIGAVPSGGRFVIRDAPVLGPKVHTFYPRGKEPWAWKEPSYPTDVGFGGSPTMELSTSPAYAPVTSRLQILSRLAVAPSALVVAAAPVAPALVAAVPGYAWVSTVPSYFTPSTEYLSVVTPSVEQVMPTPLPGLSKVVPTPIVGEVVTTTAPAIVKAAPAVSREAPMPTVSAIVVQETFPSPIPTPEIVPSPVPLPISAVVPSPVPTPIPTPTPAPVSMPEVVPSPIPIPTFVPVPTPTPTTIIPPFIPLFPDYGVPTMLGGDRGREGMGDILRGGHMELPALAFYFPKVMSLGKTRIPLVPKRKRKYGVRREGRSSSLSAGGIRL